jgi:hypothetical protein
MRAIEERGNRLEKARFREILEQAGISTSPSAMATLSTRRSRVDSADHARPARSALRLVVYKERTKGAEWNGKETTGYRAGWTN